MLGLKLNHVRKKRPLGMIFCLVTSYQLRLSLLYSSDVMLVGPCLLTHWGWDEMDAIMQTIFSNAFSERKCLNSDQKFVPRDPINNIPALVQIMTLRRPGDKPLSEPMMVTLLTHICVTRPQWVKQHHYYILSMVLHDIYLSLQALSSGQEIAGRINWRLHFKLVQHGRYIYLACLTENQLLFRITSCTFYISGLVYDCCNSSALAMELQQSCSESLACNDMWSLLIAYF